MQIVVCTRETPDTAARIEIRDGKAAWGDAPLVINPWDEYAVEEAIRLKDRGAELVTVLSLGSDATLDSMRHALAMGCDAGILVDDPLLSEADTLVASYALAQAIIKLEQTSLVLFGKMTTDYGSGVTAVQVGRRLKWNTLTSVSKILSVDFSNRTIEVERLLDNGKETVSATLPVVISVVKEINEPRYPSFVGIKKASRVNIPVWTAADIGAESTLIESQVVQLGLATPPQPSGVVELIEGTTVAEKATKLVEKLIADKVV